MNARSSIVSSAVCASRPKWHGRIRRIGGFTLVELMIALVLGLLVVLGASTVMLSNNQSYRTNDALDHIQENSRIAFELLSRDLRQARLTGCGNEGTTNNDINNSTDAANWFADFANRGLIGYGGTTADNNPALTTGEDLSNHVSGTDSITLIGAGDVSYSLKADYVASDGLDITESSPALGLGTLVVICDPSQADIAQITGTNSGKFRLLTGVGTPGNSTGLAYIYHGSNTLVSALKSVTWYIGCNPLTALKCDPDHGGTSLYRLTAGSDPSTVSVTTEAQEIARGVSKLEIKFHRSGDGDFTSPADIASWDPNVIDAVSTGLTFVGFDKAKSVSATPITRTLSATVALRNPPKD